MPGGWPLGLEGVLSPPPKVLWRLLKGGTRFRARVVLLSGVAARAALGLLAAWMNWGQLTCVYPLRSARESAQRVGTLGFGRGVVR